MNNEWKVTDDERTRALEMAQLGLPLRQIAVLLKRREDEIGRVCETELATGTAQTNYEALKALRRMVTSGTCASATMFWVRSRCGFGTNGCEDETPFDSEEFRVISNSGKPPVAR